ncbi:hypothetical protein HYX08_02995 [Candidatus Woesearchaeota archaeon]|nr:hypothetical protein [Candidatus Woesearchaeota archaeon]
MGQLEDAHVLVEVDDVYRYAYLQRRWLELYRISDGKAKEDFNFVRDSKEKNWTPADHDHIRQLEANLDYLMGLGGIITPTKGGVLNSSEEQKLEYFGLPEMAISFLSHAGIRVQTVNIPYLERLLQEEFFG